MDQASFCLVEDVGRRKLSRAISSDQRVIGFLHDRLFTFEGARQVYQTLFTDPEYDPLYDTISDFSYTEQMDIQFDQVVRYRALVKKLDTRVGKVAFVMGCNTGRFMYGKTAALQFNIVKKNVYKAFKSRKEALDWLKSGDEMGAGEKISEVE